MAGLKSLLRIAFGETFVPLLMVMLVLKKLYWRRAVEPPASMIGSQPKESPTPETVPPLATVIWPAVPVVPAAVKLVLVALNSPPLATATVFAFRCWATKLAGRSAVKVPLTPTLASAAK